MTWAANQQTPRRPGTPHRAARSCGTGPGRNDHRAVQAAAMANPDLNPLTG
jgi:hypothetical protein